MKTITATALNVAEGDRLLIGGRLEVTVTSVAPFLTPETHRFGPGLLEIGTKAEGEPLVYIYPEPLKPLTFIIG